MTNKEAAEILKNEDCNECTFGGFGNNCKCVGCEVHQALNKAIEALEFAESQTLCCDNCVNRTRKSEEVCTSPYGLCEFFEDKTQKGGCNYEK